MLKSDIINSSSGISPGKNEANLDDVAVDYLISILHKTISINGKAINIAMPKKFLGMLSRLGIIEKTESINAIVPILKNRMPKNIVRGSPVVPPNKRNSLTVIILKGVLTNNSPVRTKKVIHSSIAAKIKVLSPQWFVPPNWFR